MTQRILVVDDERLIRWSLRERLTAEGYDVLEAADGAGAKRIIDEEEFDAALLDLRLPDADGADLVERVHDVMPHVPVIVITAYSSIDSAVRVMKAGAIDYIAKPFDMDDLASVVRRAIEAAEQQGRAGRGERPLQPFGLEEVIGETEAMVDLRSQVRQVAMSEADTALLQGESGAGKRFIAHAIHFESGRTDRPFLQLQCTGMPESLLESTLFGIENTPAMSMAGPKEGLLELASGGTILLNDVADLPLSIQEKLLAVLETGAFMRMSGTEAIPLDVRVLAATCRRLEPLVEEGLFRRELFYRLTVVRIEIPPLRQRAGDIPLLARHFLQRYGRTPARKLTGFSSDALGRLDQYDWPGNVRELRDVIRNVALVAQQPVITAEHIELGRAVLRDLPRAAEYTVQLPTSGCDLADIEKALVRQALIRADWNQSRAARLLGVSRDQVRYKMAKFGIKQA